MAITKEVNIVVKETGLDEVNKKVNKLETSVGSLEDQQQSLSKSMGNSSQSVLDNGGAMGLLNDATGGLAMTVKDAVEASWLFTKSQKAAAIQQSIATTVVGTSTGAMKAFRIALAATGVGLLVIGLGLLIANFDKVKKVVLNLVPGLAAVGDMVMNIVNAVTDFIGITSEADREAERIKNNAIKRSEEIDKRLKEDGSRYSESAKKKMAIESQLQKDIAEGKWSEVKLRKEAAFAIAQIDKDNAEKIAKIEKDKQDKLNEIAKTARDKKIDDDKKDLEKRLEARKDELSKFNDVEKEFEAQREEERIKKLKAEDDAKKKVTTDIEATLKARQNGLDAEKKANEERIRDEELVRDAKFQIANSVFDLVNMFAKKGSKLAKGVAAAQATMNTYQGITAALAAPSTVPEPFGQVLRIANAVSIGAMGLINVKKILSTNEQGSTTAPSSGGGQAPQAPSFNLVQGTGRNQIAEGLNKQSVVKAYVVPTDVSTGQSLDRNIVKSASL